MPVAVNNMSNCRTPISIDTCQLPVLQAGHFLFTSESVGEGHPGLINAIIIVMLSSF
jgi:hypothetical protein